METYYPGLTRIHELEEPQRAQCPAANVGKAERIASLIAGGGLAMAGLRRIDSLSGMAMLLAGGGLVYRGATGKCHMYQALGINTSERNPARGVPAGYGSKVEASVTIRRPPRTVYCYWRDLENLPTFMSHLESVEAVDANRSHWIASGPLGTQAAWDAEIINEKENELIAWRSLEGSAVDTAGSVHFYPRADGRETEVRVSLKYNPPGGMLGIGAAWLFGESAQQQIEEDMLSLKQSLEAEHEYASAAHDSAGVRAATAESAARLAESPCENEIDEASYESFPASDPPAWNSSTATQARRETA